MWLWFKFCLVDYLDFGMSSEILCQNCKQIFRQRIKIFLK